MPRLEERLSRLEATLSASRLSETQVFPPEEVKAKYVEFENSMVEFENEWRERCFRFAATGEIGLRHSPDGSRLITPDMTPQDAAMVYCEALQG